MLQLLSVPTVLKHPLTVAIDRTPRMCSAGHYAMPRPSGAEDSDLLERSSKGREQRPENGLLQRRAQGAKANHQREYLYLWTYLQMVETRATPHHCQRSRPPPQTAMLNQSTGVPSIGFEHVLCTACTAGERDQIAQRHCNWRAKATESAASVRTAVSLDPSGGLTL